MDADYLEMLTATDCGRDVQRGGDSKVAAEFGISTRTLYRRRNRTLAALREVADGYLAAVADLSLPPTCSPTTSGAASRRARNQSVT